MAKDIYQSLNGVNASTKARRQLQPAPDDMGKKNRGSDPSYGISNMGTSNKKKTGRYKGLA